MVPHYKNDVARPPQLFHVSGSGSGEGNGNHPDNSSKAQSKNGKETTKKRGGNIQKAAATTTHVAIYDVTADAKRSLHRQFLRTSDGTILEVFGEVGREVGRQLGASLNALIQTESGNATGTGAGGVKKEQGIFAGLLPVTTGESGARMLAVAGAAMGNENALSNRRVSKANA